MTPIRDIDFIKKLNLKLTCRICLNDSDVGVISPIFHKENDLNHESIKDKLFICCGLIVEENDALPSKICSLCNNELNAALLFIKKCKDSEELLRKFKYTSCFDENYENKPIKQELESINFASDLNDSIDYYLESDVDEFHVSKYRSDHNGYDKSIFKKIKKKRKKRKLENVKSEIKCVNCNLVVQSQSALIIHKRTHTGERPFECSVCNKTFAQKSTLRVHIVRRHMGKVIKSERRFICEVCQKTFASLTNLKIHIRIHTGEYPYECKLCSRRFMQLGTLTSHKRRHLGEKPFSCKICGKAFVERSHLRRHQSVHSEEKPFVCNICGKGLKSTYALRQHIKLHDNLKEHICDQCGTWFTIKGNLDAHIKMLHSERSGQCSICNKICSNLDDHMSCHSGEKKYQCGTCDKKFTHKRGLIVHYRQHTEANKFHCTFKGCSRSFYAQWVLDCHLSKHTGYTPHPCKYCPKGFLRVCHLNKHLKVHHSVELKATTSFKNKDKFVNSDVGGTVIEAS